MTNYLIKQGNHYASGLHFGVHFGITEQKYRVRFSKECLYTPLDLENDWNKLCGWSYGMHHKNSIRVCWRPYVKDNKFFSLFECKEIELCIYVYQDGKRLISNTTVTVEVDKEYDFRLKYDVASNMVSIFDLGIIGLCPIRYYTKPSCGYRLYPYFGGNLPSPQNMNIELTRL